MGRCGKLHDPGLLRAARIAAPLLGLAMVVNLSLPGEPAALFASGKCYSFQAENRLPESTTASPTQQGSGLNTKQTETVRKQQIASDSVKLLQMAVELKAEMDKSSKDTLSLNIVRKADAITRLAHDLKEEMKQNSGEN